MYFAVFSPASRLRPVGAISAKVFCMHPLCLVLECTSWKEIKTGSINGDQLDENKA
jgi:hypothetical protein